MKTYERLSKNNELDVKIEYRGDGLSLFKTRGHKVCVVGCDFAGAFNVGTEYDVERVVGDETQDERFREIVKETMLLVVSFVDSFERGVNVNPLVGETHHSAQIGFCKMTVVDGHLSMSLNGEVDHELVIPNNVDEFILYCEE